MITTKYTEYLLEKKIYTLILESKIVFSSKFSNILDDIRVSEDGIYYNMAQSLIKNCDKEVNINDNYIDVADNPAMIKFTPDDKVDQSNMLYRLNSEIALLPNTHNIIKQLGFTNCINSEPDFNLNWIISEGGKTLYEYPNLMFYVVEELGNPKNRICVYCNSESKVLLPSGVNSNKTTEVRFGRFLNRFFAAIGVKYTQQDIEGFVNLYQSILTFKRNANDHFKIVKGEMIRHWYDEFNYENEKGQLGNSCMRYEKCREYLDIYCENTDVCQLLILTTDKKTLLGRALLWTTTDGVKFMDRIYTNKDSYTPMFRKWGTENGYVFDAEKFKVKVKYANYTYLPYMDTFSYYQPTEGLLLSYYPSNDGKTLYGLENTDGTFLKLRL